MSNIGRTAHLVGDAAPAEIVGERDYELASPGVDNEVFVLYSLRWPTGVVTNHRDSEIVIDDSTVDDSVTEEAPAGEDSPVNEEESKPSDE